MDQSNRSACIESVLRECLEYFKARYDVIDGDDGQPKPNLEMCYGMMITAALEED